MWFSLSHDKALTSEATAAFEALRQEIGPLDMVRTSFTQAYQGSDRFTEIVFVSYDHNSGKGLGVWFGPGAQIQHFAGFQGRP